MRVLGIETSCDETAASVVDDLNILSNVVSSQTIHKKYGGIVPEFASREQIRALIPIVESALAEADSSLENIDGIAVTCGPGLAGSLLMGLNFAKGISLASNKSYIAVNHLEGHLFANRLSDPDLNPPFVFLLVSGGHTQLIHVKDWGDYAILGATLDDAVGEAFDKVAKMLGLGYPGGPEIDRLAQRGDSSFQYFPRALDGKGYDFSFSGIKTSVLYYLKKQKDGFIEKHIEDISASFQKAVVEILTKKTIHAVKFLNLDQIVVGGGVSANSGLREELTSKSEADSIKTIFPPISLTTDNGAMIAAVGAYYLEKGLSSSLTMNVYPNLGIQDATD
ncbi:MAG: tRNA (adenosine(37)-N6)-threonylcarbamoyltransferase complex transferase subunit TsaD [Candidatus Marinimicrobia bacterium]|nr:tRNA (adenosine(37)-N6)-threonylcarbamoyltransferase complex transferase subunit TsaD [Candidatus Neomarinimicrobiota bacterium]